MIIGAFSFIDDQGVHSSQEVGRAMDDVAKILTEEKAIIVIESERSLQSAVRFMGALRKGRIPFMLPTEEFQNPDFLQYVKSSLGKVALWPKTESRPLAAEGAIHPMIDEAIRGFIVKTSGTSGMKNKFVLHDPENFLKKFSKRKPSFERTINFFPPDSIAGVELMLEASVQQKCIVNPGTPLEPASVVKLLGEHNIDLLHVTPTFLNMMLIAGGLTDKQLSSVKCLAYGSEPAQKSVLEKVRALNPSMELIQIYGMSEIGLQKTLPVNDSPECFRLDSHVNPYRISEGLLEVKSESPMLGYLNNDRKVADGWFATGDAVGEKDGLLRVIGRSDDVINVAGKKFHPIQLEELIMEMPEVDDVMVTAEPHELIGHSVTAHISTRVEEKEFRGKFREYLEKHVTAWMRPQKVVLNPAAMSSRLKKRRKTSI